MPNTGNQTMRALEDEELSAVSGGAEVVFQEGVNRDSWFVSIITRQMVQNSIRSYLSAPEQTVPDVITVGDRRYRVRQVGETYYVEALS
jgi:hypothetical protein